MPLKKVLADLGRGVWSPSGGKKNHKNAPLYFQSGGNSSLPNRHIYYEPPEDLDWDQETALVPPDTRTGTSEVIVHRRDTRSPVPNSGRSEPDSKENLATVPKPNGTPRAYTEEEFTSAILARTQHGNAISSDGKVSPSSLPHQLPPNTSPCRCPSQEGTCDHGFDHGSPESCSNGGSRIKRSQSCSSQHEGSTTCPCSKKTSVDNGVSSCGNVFHLVNVSDSVLKEGSSPGSAENTPEAMVDPQCDCEKGLNPRHSGECKVDSRRSDYASSPILERRNKGVLGRLRNFASRTSYSTSEDGHSHSSDYEEQEEDKRPDIRFARDSSARSSSSWAGRVRDLHRDVKRKISRLRNSKGAPNEDEAREGEIHDGAIQPASSVESIPSGSGSSLQPPTPTSSNRSSTSAGEEDNSPYVGTFMGRARALVDYTPSPYDRDGLAFKKGDLIDIIAKHKTGIWVGMVQGKVGHFKFINVEEILSESKPRQRRHKTPPDWFNLEKKPGTLEELLLQLGLQEYMNVLVLNGYDELDAFKEIEKVDLDNLGIVNPEHGQKLLRAAELFSEMDLEGEDEDDDPSLKQSPRDSGCYASHENLIHRETSQRLLQNGQCMVDGEDQDTSHSESGIHSREGQDLSSLMNNLDVSVDSSTKSTSTTVDSTRDDAGITTDTMDCYDEKEMCKYNIPPLQDSLENQMSLDITTTTNYQEIQINLDSATAEPTQMQPVDTVLPCKDTNSMKTKPSVSEFQITPLQPSDVSGSRKKHRNKHSRDKSFVPNYKQDSKHKDHSHSSHSLTWCRYQTDIPNDYVEYYSYVHSWASFSKRDRSVRRKVKEYDDVVSDPATEPDESPGKHVYRRVKQRKGSLQALIPCPSPSSPTIVGIVKKRLDFERINLCDEPYTDKTGFCGIPPALVQRYAEELQQSIGDTASALDQIRITSLQQQARRGVPNDFLTDSCIVPVIEANYSNLHNWLISLGLPMYEECFSSFGYSHLNQIISLDVSYLSNIGISNPYHQVYLEAAINALQIRLGQRPSISPPPLPEPSSSSSSSVL